MTQPARFKQGDATRALRGALKAGLKPSECIIDPMTGNIRLVFSDEQPAGSINPMDRVLRPCP